MSFRFAPCVLIAACSPAVTPLPVTTFELRREYLRDVPTGVTGQLQHVKDGVFCTDDDAFAVPLVPFPDGPTEVQDDYVGEGVTAWFNQFDAKQSVVQVRRFRLDQRTPEEMMAGAEREMRAMAAGAPEIISTEYVIDGGRKQLQLINRASCYAGKGDALMLAFGQSIRAGGFDTCRVDREFADGGYFFQVFAVALGVTPAERACTHASELASWTVEHLQVGKGCGPRKRFEEGRR